MVLMELTEILLNLVFFVSAIGISLIIVLHHSKSYEIKNYKVIFLIMALLFFLMFFSQYSLGYEEHNTILSGKQYYIYDVNTSEVPIEINKTLYNLYYNNMTNQTDYQVLSGTYIDTVSEFTSTPDNQSISLTINFDEEDVGTYNTWIKVLDNNLNLINETFFRFNLNYGSLANESVNYSEIPMGLISDGLVYHEVFDSELPKTITTTHNIKSIAGYHMTINCTSNIECNKNYTETSDIITFSSTLTIPETRNIGTYNSIIHLNTSYNKTGNITIRYKVKDTPIEVIEKEILHTKPLSNMTEEELIAYWKQVKDASNEAISKIEASKPKEKIVENNISVPYLANKDEIVTAVMNEFSDRINDRSIRLAEDIYKDAEGYRSKYYTANQTIHNLSLLLDNLKQDVRLLKMQNRQNLIGLNESFHDQNFVMSKKTGIITVIILILVSVTMVGYYVYEKEAVGDY